MNGEPEWMRLPAAVCAVADGRYGALLRLARTAAGLTLDAAGQRVGYSASTLSRLESGRRPMTDVVVLRRLAGAFGIPPHLFGLSDTGAGVGAARDASGADRVPDRADRRDGGLVRRRDVLASLGGGLAGLAAAPLLPVAGAGADIGGADADPAAALVDGLERVLLHGGTGSVDLAGPDALRAGLATARADFQASRYAALAARLPALVSAAGADDVDQAVAAEVFNTAVHVCIKLQVSGLDWLAADRALAASRSAGDPAVTANVTRNVVSLLRGAGRYASAQHLALTAANDLPLSSASPSPEHLSLYGALLCNAGYAAAQGGDRSRSAELLDEADRAAARLGGDHNARWTAFGPTEVTLHRISAAWRLGDAGTAIDFARAIPAGTIRLPERQARLFVDVARCFDQWARPADCYRALRAAETAAPEEIRAQPKVRALARRLLSAPSTPAMSGLREFATRLHLA